jgi:hypothetical protein
MVPEPKFASTSAPFPIHLMANHTALGKKNGNRKSDCSIGDSWLIASLSDIFVLEPTCQVSAYYQTLRTDRHGGARRALTGIAFRVYVPTMKTLCYLSLGLLRYSSSVVLLLFCFASPFAYAAFAQPTGLEDAGKQLGKIFRDARINKVVVSDFIGDRGHVTLQGVLLADRLSFALLEEQGFETLNRDRLNMHLYGPTLPKNESLETAEMNAARAAGAEVIVTGKIERNAKTVKI